MRLLIMGPPGAGKGTQAAVIADHHRVPAVSTGDGMAVAMRAAPDAAPSPAVAPAPAVEPPAP